MEVQIKQEFIEHEKKCPSQITNDISFSQEDFKSEMIVDATSDCLLFQRHNITSTASNLLYSGII